MRGRAIGIATICLLIAGALFAGAPAAAKTIKPYSFSGSSFTGTGDPKVGTFNSARYIAVNEVTGNVYVMDSGNGGLLRKFNSAGVPVPFSDPGLAGENVIALGPWADNTFSTGGAEIAVDNFGGPTQGNIFAARVAFSPSKTLLFGFKESGEELGGHFPICGIDCGFPENWLGLEGAAVDPDGDVWASSSPFFGTPPMEINPFGLNGLRHPTKKTFLIGQGGHDIFGDKCCKPGSTMLQPKRFIFDSAGNLYATGSSIVGCQCGFRMIKYDPDKKVLNSRYSPIISNTSGSSGARGQLAIDLDSNHVFINYGSRVDIYDGSGKRVDSFGIGSLNVSMGVAVNSVTNDVYVTNGTGPNKVDIYKAGPEITVPDVTTGDVSAVSAETATLEATIDPDGGGDTTECYFEYGFAGGEMSRKADCTVKVLPSAGGPQVVTAPAKDLNCTVLPPNCTTKQKGNKFFYRVVAKNAAGPAQTGQIEEFRNSDPPVLGNPTLNDVNSDGADIDVNINPEGGETEIRVEYGTTPSYGESMSTEYPFTVFQRPDVAKDVTVRLTGLLPDTTYHYKVVAENPGGEDETADGTFRTFAAFVFDEQCANALVRQQTGAAQLLDCRAYELVSAADLGGYNVASDQVPGQTPYAGYPDADGKVLYGVVGGGIPNTGSPTIRGIDPYVATRGADGWTTEYVGIPVAGTPSDEPFSSTVAGADSALSAFAFGGEDLCDPCFGDESAGLPLRLPNGQLVQGMQGSIAVAKPEPAGDVRKPLSADGSHLVFGSTQKFEGDATAGQLTIYDRNLAAGTTRVVSKTPGGANMTAADLSQLDISEDGSRILLGDLVGTDGEGNEYFHLYMNVGASTKTIDLTPGTTSGVRYDGMTSEGTMVFFTTKDALGADADTSADLYRADVTPTASTLTRVSTGSEGTGNGDACTPASDWNTPEGGPNCDVVAIGGGGGVATEEGSAYFFSPEKLDGAANGTAGEPNLYVAEPGSAPEFVVTLETDNPAVANGVSAAGERETSDFQVNPSGGIAAFTTTLSLKAGFENRGFAQVYGHDSAADEVVCISCPLTNAPSVGGASLASNGLSIADDGRVFFNGVDPLVLRDSNGKQDAFEWDEGTVELISTGTVGTPSSLLSVSSDGVDALFFTRENRVPQDKNGPIVKIYDARSGGGFFFEAPQQPCKASDECHGASSEKPAFPNTQSTEGTPGQFTPAPKPKPCKKGFVRKSGKCVKKKKPRKQRKRSTGRNG